MPLIENKVERVRRVGIVGSRRRKSRFDRDVVFDIICQEIDRNSPVEIVSGGCLDGAEHFAEEAAEYFNLPKTIHRPKDHGVSYHDRLKAFHARNEFIVGDSDIIYALVHEDRTGSCESAIRFAWDFKVPVVTCLPTGKRMAQFGNMNMEVIATAALAGSLYTTGEKCRDCGETANTGWRLCSSCIEKRDQNAFGRGTTPVAIEIFRP